MLDNLRIQRNEGNTSDLCIKVYNISLSRLEKVHLNGKEIDTSVIDFHALGRSYDGHADSFEDLDCALLEFFMTNAE